MKKRVVFIHQNFPAQFVHVARALTAQGHEVVAVAVTGRELPGVRLIKYHPEPLAHASVLRGVSDFETKVIRGLGVLGVLEGLKAQAWRPDLVVVHPGWGEALFVKDVWPDCRMVVFNEFVGALRRFNQRRREETTFEFERRRASQIDLGEETEG